MKLLIIRPEPGASATAARAQTAGFEPLVMPFFEVRAREWNVPNAAEHDALLLTSANAVRHGGAGLAALAVLPVHTVGERTAAAARAAGLTIASSGPSDANAALAAARAAGHERLLWLAGEDHRPPAAGYLTLDIRIVYASEAVALPDDAQWIIAAADAVGLHSPRAATRFGDTLDRLKIERSRLIVAAFSPAIAAAAGTGWRTIVTAATPDDSALLSSLAQLGKSVAENALPKER